MSKISDFWTKDVLDEALKDRFHSGGVVGRIMDTTPILADSTYYLPREQYERLQSKSRLHRQGDSYPKVVSRQIHIVNAPVFYAKPRTGDREQMLADIDHVEKTPATRQGEIEAKIIAVMRGKSRILRDMVSESAMRATRW